MNMFALKSARKKCCCCFFLCHLLTFRCCKIETLFLYWLHAVYRIPPQSSNEARVAQYTWCLCWVPCLDSGFQQPTKPHTLHFCLLSQWQHESAPVWFDLTVFKIYFDTSDWWRLGPQLELALLHSSHNHRLLLCPEPGAGSPFWVGSHFSPT